MRTLIPAPAGTIIITLICILTACGREACEKESFGYIEFDNQTLQEISIQITVADVNKVEEALPDINLDTGLTIRVEVPEGIIKLECEPAGSDSLGLLRSCETIFHVFDFLDVCGTCELVTEDVYGNKTYSTPLQYCGDDLEERKNSIPITLGGFTTWWNCY